MPVQEGAGGSEAMDQSPTPGVMLRSTPEDAGQALFSADGGTLYFQPNSFSENGGKLMVWDGTTLSDTGVSNADSLLAANGGYSYTSENKLYHGTSLVRDFSGEALLGTSAFTLRVFGADSGYLYLFANGSDASYAILRVNAGWNNRADFVYRHRRFCQRQDYPGPSRGERGHLLLHGRRLLCAARVRRPAAPPHRQLHIRPVLSLGGRAVLHRRPSESMRCADKRGRCKEAGGRLRPLPTGRVRRDCLLHIGGLRRFRVQTRSMRLTCPPGTTGLS